MTKLFYPFIFALFLLHFAGMPSRLIAQSQPIFERISPGKGIAQSIVYSIVQDTFGNIWAGTEEGIIRYNSKTVKTYHRHSGLPRNIKVRTQAVYIDSQKNIWAGTESGLLRYQFEGDSFMWLQPHRPDMAPATIKCIVEDQRQRLWIGTINGVWLLDFNEDKVPTFTHVVPELNIEAMCLDENRLLLGATKGLFVLDVFSHNVLPAPFNDLASPTGISAILKKDNDIIVGTRNREIWVVDASLSKILTAALPKLQGVPVKKIINDGHDGFYIATDGGGMLQLDRQFRVIQTYMDRVNRPGSVASNGVYDLLLSSENMLWVATYGGGLNVQNLREPFFENITHRLNDPNSLGHNFTRAVLEDKEGNIWFGTKEGISIWYKSANRWKHIQYLGQNASGVPYIIMALKEDGEYVWAATYGNGVYKIHKKSLAVTDYGPESPPQRRIELSRIYTILIDARRDCWVGGIDKQLSRISASGSITTYPLSQIRMLVQSKDGSILAAGKTGVYRINNEVITPIEALAPKGQLIYSTINCLWEDADGTLLIGTNGNGIVQYRPDNNQINLLTTVNGMPSDIVQAILRDHAGGLWASTTRGISHITPSESGFRIKTYGHSDGLISDEFNYGSYARFADGTLAFGGTDGVSFIFPHKISHQLETPHIYFEKIHVLNQKSSAPNEGFSGNGITEKPLQLKYYENDIAIQFVGILHEAPGKVRYMWKMEGLTDDWSEPAADDQVIFSNLASGDYTFRVKACNQDGHWGGERQLKIRIAPPWWASVWAKIIYLMLALALAYGIFYLTRLLITKRNAEEQIAFFSNITHELKTPLSILLSSLNQAAKTPPDQKLEETNSQIKNTIERLNTLFNQLLNFNKITSDNLQHREISKIKLKSYIESGVESFAPLLQSSDIHVAVQLNQQEEIFYYDREALDKILFNLLSNAIKYSKKSGKIIVELASGPKSTLRLTVSDNGIGIPKDQQKFILKRYYRGRNAINSQLPGTGLGLMIVKNLIERDNGSITFQSNENEGTSFYVTLRSQAAAYVENATTATSAAKSKPETALPERAKIAEHSEAKILIVEDNNELRHMLAEQLGTHFQVFEAVNGRDGLAIVRQIFPDLVITDFMMPDMDGMELVKALKEDIYTSHIPVFMMTVLSNQEHRIASVESGVTAYMEKPIDINYLIAQIVSTLDWQKSLRERYLHQREVADAEKFRSQRDNDFLKALEQFVLDKISQEELSVHDLCRQVGMSRTALYMKLKSMVDLSPQNFIIHTRLKHARKLLREEGLNVKEVAFMTGFSNPKYFSTSFRKMFGESPTSFLKNLDDDE